MVFTGRKHNDVRKAWGEIGLVMGSIPPDYYRTRLSRSCQCQSCGHQNCSQKFHFKVEKIEGMHHKKLKSNSREIVKGPAHPKMFAVEHCSEEIIIEPGQKSRKYSLAVDLSHRGIHIRAWTSTYRISWSSGTTSPARWWFAGS